MFHSSVTILKLLHQAILPPTQILINFILIDCYNIRQRAERTNDDCTSIDNYSILMANQVSGF